jgi:predicted nucleic acid-binding protein
LQKKETDKATNKDLPYKWIKPLVLEAEAGNLAVVVSSLAVAEVFFIRDVAPTDQMKVIDEFFDFVWVRAEAATIKIAKIAQKLRRDHKVDPIDSIHVATALATESPVFLTYDGIHKKKTPLLPLDNLLSIDGSPPFLRIRTPERHQQILHSSPLFPAEPAPPPTSPPTPPGPPAGTPTVPISKKEPGLPPAK